LFATLSAQTVGYNYLLAIAIVLSTHG